MKEIKKLGVLLLVLISMVAVFGCTAKADSQETKEEATGTVDIVDMAGRTVTIPATVKTIATPNVDAYRILLQLGAEDMLVGVPSSMYGSKYSEVDTIEVVAWPEVKNLEQVGGGPPGTEINVEALMALKPDVIISWSYGKSGTSAEQAANDLQTKSGIPVICLNNISSDDTNMAGIEKAYQLVGTVAGKTDEAEALLAYYQEEVKKVTAITDAIPEDQRKTAYMASTSGLLKANTSYLPMKQLGVINVAKDAGSNGTEVAKEQLIAWDPEIIFIHTPSKSYSFDMAAVVSDPTINTIQAIKNQNYYHVKGTYMGWDIATGLVDLVYMAKATYPEQFKNVDVEKKGDEILAKFYRMDGLYQRLIDNNGFTEFNAQ